MGILLRLLLPVIVFLILYFIKFNDKSLKDFFDSFINDKSKITFVGVWALVSNIALFTYYVNTGRDRTAKGVFAVTLLYGIGILLAKVLV